MTSGKKMYAFKRLKTKKTSAAILPDQRTLREERIIAARSSDCTVDVLKINLLLSENFPSIDFKSVGSKKAGG